MLENLSWVFIPDVLFAEIDSDQVRNDCVVLATDKVQADVNRIW